MPRTHQSYLIIEQGVGAALINFVLNGVIAYLIFGAMEMVPTWGQPSIAGDMIITIFLLPFITTLIVTPLAKREIRNGRLPRMEWRRDAHPLLGRLPASTLPRALVVGVACVILFAPISLWTLAAFGVMGLRLWPFLTFKAAFAAALAAVATPIIALCALADVPEGFTGGVQQAR